MHGEKFSQIFAKHVVAQPMSKFKSFTTSGYITWNIKVKFAFYEQVWMYYGSGAVAPTASHPVFLFLLSIVVYFVIIFATLWWIKLYIMTSHTLCGLAGSRRKQRRAAGGRHGRHLESLTSYQKSPSIDAYLLEVQSWQISCRSYLKRQSLGLFEDGRPKKQEEEQDEKQQKVKKVKVLYSR